MVQAVRADAAPQTLPASSRLGPRRGPVALQGRTTVGVDLGGGSLKLVQLSWGRTGARLETFAWVPLPPGAADDGVIARVDEVADILRATCTALHIRPRQFAACAGGIGIMMRAVSVPALPAGDLAQAMKFEAPQALLIPEDQLVYDFAALPDSPEVPHGQTRVFLAGTHRSLVDSYAATFRAARLRLEVLDLECLSVLRSLDATGQGRGSEGAALVMLDWGEAGLGLTILHHGLPVLTRHLPGGMAELRAQVAGELDLTLAEAQARIWNEGLAPGTTAAAAALPWLRRTAEGIARSVDFFLIQNRGTGVERVYLYGAWAAVPHLAGTIQGMFEELLASSLEQAPLRVQVADLAGLPMHPAAEAGALAAGPVLLPALGAALRGGPEE